MSPRNVIEKWVEAFNLRDADLAASLYHVDAENLQIAFGIPLKGRDAIYQDLKTFFQHNPDNETHIVRLYEDGEWAILEWNGNATFYLNPDSKGKPYRLQGCGFFHVIDGKIKFQRGYFDKYTWFNQVDLPVK